MEKPAGLVNAMDSNDTISECTMKYGTLINKLFQSAESEIIQHLKKYEKEINEAMIYDLYGQKRKQVPEADLSPTKKMAIGCISRLLDMVMSVEIISDFPVYFRKFPFRADGISRERYIRFLLSSYFNEIWMLRDRMHGFPMWIARERLKKTKNTELEHYVIQIRKWIDLKFHNFREVRNFNTHEMRYKEDYILSLSTAESFEHLSKYTLDFSNFFSDSMPEDRLKDFRKKWVNFSENYSLRSYRVMAEYCDIVEPLIFDNEGNLLPHKDEVLDQRSS